MSKEEEAEEESLPSSPAEGMEEEGESAQDALVLHSPDVISSNNNIINVLT